MEKTIDKKKDIIEEIEQESDPLIKIAKALNLAGYIRYKALNRH